MTLERTVLNALAQDIDERPEVLLPVDATLVKRMRHLVADVEVDLEQALPPEFGDAGMP